LKSSFNIIVSTLLVTLFTLCLYIGFTSHQEPNIAVFNNMIPESKKYNEYSEKNDFKAKEVTYINEDNTINLSGLSEADIIFEYINSIGKNSYKAIFTKSIPRNIHPAIDVKDRTINYIPRFNFLDKDEPSQKYNIAAKSIFINFNNLCCSNFIYNGEYYIHYRDTVKDIDNNNSSPLPLSNIIVQFIDKKSGEYNIETDIGNGSGYIFTGGKGIQIKWNKDDTNPIKFTDNSYSPIFFSSGLTWWVFLDKSSSIIIN
jgi:hypothetical protein